MLSRGGYDRYSQCVADTLLETVTISNAPDYRRRGTVAGRWVRDSSMADRVSEAALERADLAVAVMAVFRMEARAITEASLRAPAGASVLAVVQPDLRSAIYVLPTSDVALRQPELEGEGWSLLFEAGSGGEAIERAVLRSARLAEQRRDALFRYAGLDEAPRG